MIRAPMAQSVGPAASSFYTSAGMGMVYSALVAPSLLRHMVRPVDRRAAQGLCLKYYMHPEAFYHARRPRCWVTVCSYRPLCIMTKASRSMWARRSC